MIVPVLCYALLSVPAADDFSNALMLQSKINTLGSYNSALTTMISSVYNQSGGYWFALFLNYFFCPFLRFGYIGIRVFNCLALAAFYATFFFFCRTMVKAHYDADRTMVLGFSTASLYLIINNYINSEIYTWYTTIAAYVLPVGVLFLGLSFFIRAKDSGKAADLILAAIFGFCANGTSLNASVLCCGLYFIITYWYFRYGPVKPWKCVLVTAFTYISAVINLIAPGNFARHAILTPDYDVFSAILVAAFQVVSRFIYLLTETPFVAIIILLCVFMFPCMKRIKNENVKFAHPILVGLLFLAGLVIVQFPVTLGYSSSHFPDRCVFIEDISIYILTFVWLWYFNGYLQRKKRQLKPDHRMRSVVLLICALFSLLTLGIQGAENNTTYYMIASLGSGAAQNYAANQLDLLDQIENSPSDSVVVYTDPDSTNRIINPTGITSDKDNWVNTSVAAYYSKDVVIAVPSLNKW